jgi:TPR repeat protein
MRKKKLLVALTLALTILFGSVSVGASSLDKGIAALDNGDYSVAVELLLPLAIGGDAQAQYYMGFMYAVGKGVQRSDQKKLEWYERSAKSGYVLSFGKTGDSYYRLGVENSISGPTPESEIYYKQAFKWYFKAADKGHISGLNGLGRLYHSGRGVERSKALAMAYYTEAAALGDYFSQYTLADILQHDYRKSGNIVDLEQSYKWFKIWYFYHPEDDDTYASDSYNRALRYRVYKQLNQGQVYRITLEAIDCVKSNFKDC